MNSYPPSPREVTDRLEAIYGHTEYAPRFNPMDELISCVLSQHTSDALSFPAFHRMMNYFGDYAAIEAAPTAELAEVIKGAGLSNQKSVRIQKILKVIREERGEYNIDFLAEMPWREGRDWLTSLPGIGPKCAAITLCFAFGLPVIPVDTHVFRVGWRLGYFEKKIGEAKAHDALQAQVPDDLAFCFHVCLIEHGRKICKAPLPRCEMCPLTDVCRYYNEFRAKGQESPDPPAQT